MRKLTKEPSNMFGQAARELVMGATRCVEQNNEIDLFEEYFHGEDPEFMSEPITTKTVMIFKDPNSIKRSVTKIAWHPEQSELRVGTAYAQLRFQQTPSQMPKASYIWNLNNPNSPEIGLEPTSPLCTMAFSPKNSDLIAGGSYNGSICFFDRREHKGHGGSVKATETSILEKSHHDPVYDIYWIAGKSGSECVSTSTDGRLLWWDQRNLADGPTEELKLIENFQINGEVKPKVLGGTSLEYNADASPLKYLIGTEQGYILQANKRKQVEINLKFGLEQGKHHGPVYNIERNPGHLKYFLSVGDWSAKIWCEDLKCHPIMQTRYHSSYLTDGCWSPTRPGLFFLTRMDGFLDVWDFFYRQNEVAYSQKISDAVLTSIQINGSMAAIGDSDGTVSMMSMCRTLYDHTLNPREKEIMGAIFERETKREKNLDTAKRQAEKLVKPTKEKISKDKQAAQMATMLAEINQKFFEHVADGDEELKEIIQARGSLEEDPGQDGGAVQVAQAEDA